MKRISTIFLLVITASVIGASFSARGQGRARGHDKDRNRHEHSDRDNGRYDHDRYGNDRRAQRDPHHHNHHRDHNRHEVRPVHHYHDQYCDHRPVVVHHYSGPRYVYYRDYDVYYDCHRSVYISYSGRSWTMSAALPISMRHVNIRSTRRFEVDYYDDDFPRYLETRRPSYGRECSDW
mgnify:CR=1 FL=1